MIEKLQRIAQAIQILRLPSLLIGLFGLVAFIVIILVESNAGSRLLIPCIVCLLWGISMYTFIATFLAVPEQPGTPLTLFKKLKHKIVRAWYWLVSLIFLGATAAIALITLRMVLIWLRDHG